MGMVLLLLLLTGEGPTLQDQRFQLHALSVDSAFDFVTWELDALARKVGYGLLAPQRFMDDEARADFVLDYLEAVDAARRLDREITRAYVDPTVGDPDQATADAQAELARYRAYIEAHAPVAEAILGEQISQVLDGGGFGLLEQILPPVSGTTTPLPYLLIVSPRDHIETYYQKELVAGLTVQQRQALERDIEAAFPGFSAYVTAIGGLSAYPSMLLESASIDWLAEVMSHEWTHHYLTPAPLGWHYFSSAETRTINETTANLMGEWAGQEVVRRFYLDALEREKPLPDPRTHDAAGEEAAEETFDFYAEMRRTRLVVDRLLAVGKVKKAEWYMEMKRRDFVLHGYRLRILNQAYFAFHGAYASRPGAAGADPVGPTVRRLWALSETPRDFVHQISRATTLEDAERLIVAAAESP